MPSVTESTRMTIVKCRRCRADLGKTDGPTLALGTSAKLSHTTKITCRQCGHRQWWAPAPQRPSQKMIDESADGPHNASE
jgi:ribosomal protein L37E